MVADKITICNKLKKKDSASGLDVWYTTVLDGIKYKKDKVTSVVGTEVSIGNSFTILIPFSEKYIPYEKWKDEITKELYYTMSNGDFIFLEKLTEEVTPSTIVKLKSSHECCEVRSIEEVVEKYGVKIQLRVSGV